MQTPGIAHSDMLNMLELRPWHWETLLWETNCVARILGKEYCSIPDYFCTRMCLTMWLIMCKDHITTIVTSIWEAICFVMLWWQLIAILAIHVSPLPVSPDDVHIKDIRLGRVYEYDKQENCWIRSAVCVLLIPVLCDFCNVFNQAPSIAHDGKLCACPVLWGVKPKVSVRIIFLHIIIFYTALHTKSKRNASINHCNGIIRTENKYHVTCITDYFWHGNIETATAFVI